MTSSAPTMTISSGSICCRRRRLLIDTDGGCDDAIALLLALRTAACEIVGITTVFGNVPVEQATENVCTILRVFDATHIPIYAGSCESLIGGLEVNRWPGHGENGLGDALFLEANTKCVQAAVSSKSAVQALIDLSKQHPGELDLIALGPLTNLALAAQLDPSCPGHFRSLTIMGGSCWGRGNASSMGEFNFHCCPSGAQATLAAFAPTIPTLIVPWEAPEDCVLSWGEFDALTAGYETTRKMEANFLKKTHAKYEFFVRHRGQVTSSESVAKFSTSAAPASAAASAIVNSDQVTTLNETCVTKKVEEAWTGEWVGLEAPFLPTDAPLIRSGYICCDSFAVAALLHPSVIAHSVRHHVEVVVHTTNPEDASRGAMAIDWYDRKRKGTPGAAHVTIVTKFHKQEYMQLMMQLFQPITPEASIAATTS